MASGATIAIDINGLTTGDYILDWGGTGYTRMTKITDQGGFSIGCDSSMVILAGDTTDAYVAGRGIVGATTLENLHLASDGSVYIAPNQQLAYTTAQQWVFLSNGQVQPAYNGANATPTYAFGSDPDAGMRLTVAGNVRISAATDGTFLDVDAVNSRININRYLNISESRNELLVLNQASATGSPYIAWKQNNTQRAYIQFVDSSDLFRINLSSSTSHNFAIQLGGQNRFYIDGTGSTTGRYWFDLGQVYNTEGAEITRSTAGSVTLDWDAYNQVDLRNDGNIDTINIDDGSMQDGGHYCLVIRYATSGQTSITFSATGTLQWQGGSAPTLPNSTVGDRTVITFVKTGGLTLGFYADAPA
jgi:hypothetical protein